MLDTTAESGIRAVAMVVTPAPPRFRFCGEMFRERWGPSGGFPRPERTATNLVGDRSGGPSHAACPRRRSAAAARLSRSTGPDHVDGLWMIVAPAARSSLATAGKS